MSEEGKVRMMVIPIVAMLAVTMVVAGWQYEEQVEIDVDEGYEEMTVTVPPTPEDEVRSRNFREEGPYRATARSEINDGEGFLEIDVELGNWVGLSEQPRYDHDFRKINIDGHLGSEYDPERLRVEAQIINSPAMEREEQKDVFYFLYTHSIDSGEKGLETCSPDNMGFNSREEAFVYYEVVENNFSVEHLELYSQHHYHYSLVDEPITIEYRAILEGLLEEVRATARVTYTQEEM